MGLTRDYFVKPIPISCTIQERVEKDGAVELVDHNVLFHLRRESDAQANGASVATALFEKLQNDGANILFERFCQHLAIEPKGFDDFPTDERPLQDRAREYFEPYGFQELIVYVMGVYNRAQAPVELFRSL